MKNYHPLRKIILVISAISVANASPGFAADQPTGGVTIKKDAITIHPGTKLSQEDEKALNNILRTYNKKLYRVDKIEKGKPNKSIGELKIDTQKESELAKAKMDGITVSDVVFSPGQYAAVQKSRTFSEKQDAKRLIQEVKPILQKYSKP
jgi:hypothetical protein